MIGSPIWGAPSIPIIISSPTNGDDRKIVNIFINEEGKIVIQYEDELNN